MGMYLMRQIGTRGVYGNPILPDFMVFLGWKDLPWYWHGFDHFGFAVADGRAGARRCWRWCSAGSPSARRVTGVYLSIITQALTYALLLAFFRNDMGFGGNNGLTDFKDILGFNVQSDATRVSLFVISALVLCAGFLVVSRRRVGRASARSLIAVRDAEAARASSATASESYKLFVWVLSAVHGRHRRRALRAAGRHHQSRASSRRAIRSRP